jgi:7-cyano-7-deazaguanine synthase
MRSIVLHSGGLDSTTLLAYILDTTPSEVQPITFNYGSKHAEREIRAAKETVSFYQEKFPGRVLPTLEWDVTNIFDDGMAPNKSSLMKGGPEIPEEEYHDLNQESPSSTVVPFRNPILISLAVMHAEQWNFDWVFIANHLTDAAGAAYPDCLPESMGAMIALVTAATLRKVHLATPFQWQGKSQIAAWAIALKVPVELTYSCYRGGEKHCGRCPTCIERRKAFAVFHLTDPTEYEHESIA